jgi:hypothetical protein
MENTRLNMRDVLPEDTESVLRGLQNLNIEGTQQIEGEYEKTKEEVYLINLINESIKKKIERFNLEPRDSFPLDRIHMINNETSLVLGVVESGVYDIKRDNVLINKDIIDRGYLQEYSILLHEILHAYSFRALTADGSAKTIEPYRSGYDTNDLNKNTEYLHFTGFNEAVLEKIRGDIANEHLNEIITNLDIRNEEIKTNSEFAHSYFKETFIVDALVSKMADFYQVDKNEIWTKIQKGFFTGNMMHLRDMENVFGPGSLRVLASMSSRGSTKDSSDNLDIIKYFISDNDQEKDSFAEKILSEEEWIEYKKHKELMTNTNQK